MNGHESPIAPGVISKEAKAASLINGRYELLGRIGKGGSGAVFKAADTQRGNQTVAIKILSPEDKDDPLSLARFQKELVFTRDCKHENVVPIFDFGTTDTGYYFITMEYLDGGDLRGRLEQKATPLSFEETLRILLDAARGVAHAHSRGIVHRDLKPANILLSSSGTAKVADFGFARQKAHGQTITAENSTLGTPEYMAPEQFQNHRVDERADIYSFGLIAFEMVARRKAFPDQDGNYQSMALRHLIEPLPDFPRECSAIPRWFAILAGVCAEKNPRHRYRSMDDVVRILEKRMRKMKLLPPALDEERSLLQRIMRRL
jgi:eukaryotic-like serine/threonine-protein kinase